MNIACTLLIFIKLLKLLFHISQFASSLNLAALLNKWKLSDHLLKKTDKFKILKLKATSFENIVLLWYILCFHCFASGSLSKDFMGFFLTTKPKFYWQKFCRLKFFNSSIRTQPWSGQNCRRQVLHVSCLVILAYKVICSEYSQTFNYTELKTLKIQYCIYFCKSVLSIPKRRQKKKIN